MYDYDIAIIGGGPAGYVAASYAAQFGRSVVLIEKNKLGGCCLNTGCIPTKVLLEAARRLRQLDTDAGYGISVTTAGFSWEKLKEHSENVRSDLVNGVSGLLRSRKIEVIYEEAALKDEHTITAGDRTLTAGYMILAVGSMPSIPEKYANIKNVVTSDTFWDLNEKPESIVIVGGGVIGCEIASALSGLGTRVTIIEQLPGLLAGFSERAAGVLTEQLKKDGVSVLTDSAVTDICEADDGLVVKTGNAEFKCDRLLWAAGRRPVSIDTGNISVGLTENGFIKVNEDYRTDVDNIYCAGDANGLSMLAYSASSQAMRAVKHICTGCDTDEEPAIPMCVYTYPELAMTGLSEEKCRDLNIPFSVGTAPYRSLGYAHAISEADGYIKIIRDIGTDTVAGAEIVGADAVELIHILQPYVERKLPLKMLSDIVFAHPTLSEGIRLAVEASYIRSPQL